MALPSTGSLRFSQIEEEFGESTGKKFGGYRVSPTIGDMTDIPLDEGIGQVSDDGKDVRNGDATNSIRFSQFRGKRLNVVVHYSVDEPATSGSRAIGGHNKYTNDGDSVTAISPDPTIDPQTKAPNGKGAKVILHVSGTLLSNKENKERSALRTGNPEYWDSSVILHINVGNEAVISGSGGDGGAGGNPDSNNGRGGDGEDGSSAIGIATPVEKIIIQTGGVVQAGGGGGGGGAGVKNDLAKLSGPSGGGGSGLPAGGAAAPPPAAAAGAVLGYQMRWSGSFVTKDSEGNATGQDPTGSQGLGSGGAYFNLNYGLRDASLGWTSISDSPINESVTMTGGNGTNFQVNITYSPYQRASDALAGNSNFQTQITINSIVNSGRDYADENILSTSRWNSSGAASRILKVTSVSSSSGGNSGGVASNLGKEAGDGGNGSTIDTGEEGGVASGGGGGGGSPYGGNFVGQGGERGIKEDNSFGTDGQNGSTEKGGNGGNADAEGGDQIEGTGGTGGDNGYAIITKNVSLPEVIGTVVGQKYRGGSNIQI